MNRLQQKKYGPNNKRMQLVCSSVKICQHCGKLNGINISYTIRTFGWKQTY